MAGGFRVDLLALDQAADGVNGTIEMVSQRQVSDIPFEQSVVGNDQLAASMSDFLSRWQRGVSNLAATAARSLTASQRAQKITARPITARGPGPMASSR